MIAPRVSKPTPLARSLARYSSAILVSAAIMSAARGAVLYWDADAVAAGNTPSGTSLGGLGIWNTATTANWWDGAAADTTWSSGDTAVFTGTPGAVSVAAGGVTSSHLLFQSSGFSLGGTGALTINPLSILNFSSRTGTPITAAISAPITAASGFRFAGNGGTLTLSGTQTGISGAITLNSGTVRSVSSTTTFGPSLGVTFSGSSTFQLDNAGEVGAITRDFGALTLLGGDGVIDVQRSVAQGVTVTFASAPARLAGSTVRFNANGNSSVVGTNAKLTIAGAADGSFLPGYFASQEGGAARFATYDATNGVRPLAYGVFPNSQIISGGPAALISNVHYLVTGNFTVSAVPASIGSLAFSAGSSFALPSGVTLNIGGANPGSILKTGGVSSTAASVATISGTATIAGGASGSLRELIVRADHVDDVLIFGSGITLTGTALTKSGPGNVTISGTNSITGTTYVNDGKLTINGTGGLGANNQAVELNGGTYEVLAGNNTPTAENVTTNKSVLVNASSTLAGGRIAASTAGGNKTVQFTTLSIGNSILTADPEAVVLTGNVPAPYAIQFTGATTLTDALPSTFNVTGTQATGTVAGLTLTGVVGNGPGVTTGIVKTGTGTLALTGANTFGGSGATVEIQGGSLSINTDASLGNAANRLLLNTGTATAGLLSTANIVSSRAVVLAQPTSGIEVAASTTLTLNGLITSNGASGFTKRGAGTLVLGGTANTFGGAGSVVELQTGILDIAANGALGNIGTVRLPATVAGEQLRVSAAAQVSTTANFQLANAATTFANTINVSNTAGTLTIGGVISSATATANLTKIGTGSLELTNPGNSFGGVGTTLDVQGGSLIVSSGGALGDPSNLIRLSLTLPTERFLATGTSTARQNITLLGAGPSAAFEVAPGQTFTLAGVVANSAATDFVKRGTGTLILANNSTTAANTFGGATKTIDIQAGILGAAADTSLGNVANAVRLSGTTVGGGFLATGTFSTSRVFQLADAAANTIGVTQGNTLTLGAPFNVTGNVTAALLKNDLGNLVLTMNQPTWTGPITVSAGALRIGNATNTQILGTSAGGTTISNLGSLEFVVNGTVALANEAITISPAADNTVMVGSNNGGVIRAGAGTTAAATIATTSPIGITGVQTNGNFRSVLFGSDLGASLNIAAPISITNTATTGTFNLLLGGESTGANLLASAITNNQAGVGVTLGKIGGGTWNLTAAQTAVTRATVNAGRFVVSAAADGAGSGTGNILPVTANLTLTGTGIFAYDNGVNGVNATVQKSQTLGTLSLAAGDGRVEISRTAAQNLFLNFTTVNRTAGATGLFFAQGNTANNTNARFTVSTVAPGYLNPGAFAALNTLAATGFAFYDLTNSTIRPIAYNGTTEGFTFTSGTFTPAAASGKFTQITGGGAFAVGSALQVGSLHINSNASPTINLTAAMTIDSGVGTSGGGLLKTGGGTVATISGPSSLGTISGREFVIRVDQATDLLTIDVPIAATTGALTKSGGGTLTLTGTNAWTGATTVNSGTLSIQGAGALAGGAGVSLAGGTLSFAVNGNGFGTPEAVTAIAKDLTINGNSGLTVTRTTNNLTALNKTVPFNSLAIGGQTLTVTGQNGYGVRIANGTSLTDAVPATFNVAGTQASNINSGLALAGVVTSTSDVGFIKTGSGTLELGNAANTFGISGSVIDIQNGFVAAGSDGALGDLDNGILLNSTTANQGFRATGTFSTVRAFSIMQNTAAIEVTEGNVFSINSPLNIVTANASLTKNDNGVLELGADNASGWTGTVTINAGAIRLKTGGALGAVAAGRLTLPTSPGVAVQLSGNNVVYNPYPISLNNTGINNGGALENVSGNNTWTGPITLPAATGATIGAAGGSTLTLSGAITASAASTPLTFAGAGDITVSALLPTTNLSQLNKVGSGRLTLTGTNSTFVSPIVVTSGTVAIAGTAARLGGTGLITLSQGATLIVDDTGTAQTNRLGARPVSFGGGTFNLIGNAAANTSETIASSGSLFARGTTTINVTAGAGRSAALRFSGTVNNVAPAQNATTGPNGATVLFRGTNLGTAAGPDVATISATSATGLTFNGQNGAVGTTNKGILPWALVDTDTVAGVGTSFATADDGDSVLRALDPVLEMAGGLAANANVNLTFPLTLSARTFNLNALNFSPSMNSLTFQPSGDLNIDTSEGIVFTALSSGGIIALGTNTIANSNPALSNGVLNAPAGNSPLNIWTPGAGSLEIKIALNGGNGAAETGLVKSGAGTLTLSTPITAVAASSPVYAGLSANSFNALTAINQGTLKLNGGTNTLSPNSFVHLSAGATLDLNGRSQFLQSLFSDTTVAGGTVTSSSGSGTLVLNSDATRNFAGSITSGVSLLRSGVATGTYALLAGNSYTGSTQLSGGTTALRDAGTLANTASVGVNFATLLLDNTGTQSSGNRVNDAAAVTLRGGNITLAGRPLTSTSETLGALTLAPGLSTLTSNVSSGVALGTSIAAADLGFASLARQTGAIANFVGQVNGTATTLGAFGSAPRVTFATAPVLTLNMIGGWAIATGVSSGPEFASYVPALGVGPLGGNGFAAYDTAASLGVATATQNVRFSAAQALSANATVNSLNIAGPFTPAITFTADQTLNIVSGGLIRGGTIAASTIGAATANNRGKLTSGGTTAALASELVIYQGNSTQSFQIFSQIVNNGAAGATTALVLGGTGGSIQLAPQVSNTYTGGTTINGITTNTTGALAGVTVFPAGGLTINGAAVTSNAVNQVDQTNVVTINGGGSLTLTGPAVVAGSNRIAGLTFDNSGGGQTVPTLQTGGLLTIAGPVTASSSNPSSTALLAGKIRLESTSLQPGQNTFNVSPITFNGVSIAPTLATLAVQGIEGPGGIIKTGTGVLQFNTQATFTGEVTVQQGGIQIGAATGGSRFATVNLAANTLLNTNGLSTVIGGLAGSGVVTNSGTGASTLTIGFNDSSTSFSGSFSRFGDGIAATQNIVKIGIGKLTLNGNGNTTTGTLSVQQGEVAYSGPGGSTFSNNTIATGGLLTLDNSVTNGNNRFGGNITSSTLTMSGGTLRFIGNSGASTTETIDTLTVTNGAGIIDLQPNANQQMNLNIVTALTGVSGGGTLLIKNLSDTTGVGLATIDGSTLALNAPAGFGTGFPADQSAVRPDIIATFGSNTGFVIKETIEVDPTKRNNLRLLLPTELETTMKSGSVTPTNYQFDIPQPIAENSAGYSVVLKSGSSIVSNAPANYGRYGPNGSALSQIVISGGILVPANNNSTITVPRLTTGQNVPLTFHVLDGASLNVTADLSVGTVNTNGTNGITKSGAGTLTINGRGFYAGPTTVNEGVLNFNGGQDQAIAVAPGAGAAVLSALNSNGGTLNLGGRSQVFGQLASNNPNPGFAGTVTSATAATLTTATPNSVTFAGVLSGKLSLVKHGSGTQALTGVSTYDGTTTIRGGGIALRDEGQLMNTSAVDVTNGALTIDNSGATSTGSFSFARLPSGVPVSLFGGSLVLQGGGSADYLASLVSSILRLRGGANTVSANVGAGATSSLTLGSLVRDDNVSTVNFTGTSLGNIAGFISKVEFTTAPALPNGIIGPWAVVNGTDYASYSTTGSNRIGGLSNTTGGFAGYAATTLAAGGATNNVTFSSSQTGVGNTNVNTFRSTTNTSTITQNAGTTITLGSGASGGFLANSALTIGSTANEGKITSAGGQLFAYVNSSSTLNSSVVNGAGNAPVTLVKSGGSALTLTGNNSHTGGTIVNQGTLTLSNTTADPLTANVPIPGNLTIANGGVVGMTRAGQIRSTANVTIDGSGTLNFSGVNTVDSVTFNNRGGNANPVVNTSSALLLTSATPITTVNDTFSTTPQIAGTRLELTSVSPVITTSGAAATHLLITAPIHSAGGVIAKDGPGLLTLNPTVTLSGDGTRNSDLITDLADLGLAVGMSVTGPGVPAGTTIADLQGGGFPGGGAGQIRLTAPLTQTNGNASFVFSGSTISTGIKVNANGGGIVLGSSSVVVPGVLPSDPPIFRNGPLGTGPVTIENNGAILSDGTVRTLRNTIMVPADFVIGTPTGSLTRALAGNSVNFTGSIMLDGSVPHTVSVNGLTNTSTFGGPLVGSTTLTKAGEGTLVLDNSTNANTFSGTFSVTGGVLRSGDDGSIPDGSQVQVVTGGALDLGGFDHTLSKLTGTGVVGSSSGSNTTLTLGVPKAGDLDQAPSSTFNGSIAGVATSPLNPLLLNLKKEGAGTFTLAGKNSISGSVDVNAGTLTVAETTGELQVVQALTVNAGGKLQVFGKISGSLNTGTIVASGVGATIGGYGTIDVNTSLGQDSILSPTTHPTKSLTISDHALDLGDGGIYVYTARQSLTGGVVLSGSSGDVTLPDGGWTLRIQKLDIVNPKGMRFILFDGEAGGTGLNGNLQFGTDDVGTLIGGKPDFGTTGWGFDTNPLQETGVHYDPVGNDIYLVGVIPEPSTGMLLLSALGATAGFRRMRRRG